MHHTDVPEIGVEPRLLARSQRIVSSALAVPTCFIVKIAKESMRAGANVQAERPDAPSRQNSFRIFDPGERRAGGAYLEIRLRLVYIPHILQRRSAEHSDVPHMRMPAHAPQSSVYIPVQWHRAVLIHACLVRKRCFEAFTYFNFHM